jgi:hypothetical protein
MLLDNYPLQMAAFGPECVKTLMGLIVVEQ